MDRIPFRHTEVKKQFEHVRSYILAMEQLWPIYHPEIPPFLREFCATPAVQRLKGVGMNCGCEYTGFPRFAGLGPYSRYDHSLGVALAVWHFTRDKAQTVAGLLHDVATPAFAHVVDFLNGDFLRQESTEAMTEAVILQSGELQALLRRHDLTTALVSDYHLYPIADNDPPGLSADRLEYTLGNLVNFRFCTLDTAAGFYGDLVVSVNESGEQELAFRSPEPAFRFALGVLRCARVYVSDEDRFSMMALAELLADALRRGVVADADLLTTEPAVIAKLRSDGDSRRAWQAYTGYSRLTVLDAPAGGAPCYRVAAKKRFIDPLIDGEGRASRRFPALASALGDFQRAGFDYWLSGQGNGKETI